MMANAIELLKISLYGLAIIVAIGLFNLIMIRKETIPVMVLFQLTAGAIACYFFGKLTLIYSVLILAFLGWVKFRYHQAETPDLDYSGRILSLSLLWNSLEIPKQKMIIGRILPVNHNEIKYNNKLVQLDNIILSGGSLITGASGSGKTTTIKTIIKQRIDEKKPVVFFDYKGEEDILDDIKAYTKGAGLPYYEFSARECNFTYDPFKNLNETGKVEALMNTRRWSLDGADEHYKTSMQLVIQNLVREYDAYRVEKDDNRNYIVGMYDFATNYYRPQSNEREGYNNLIKSLEILLSSKATELFGDDPTFTFEDDDAFVICFSFTSANKALANNISSFVYTDIMDRGTRSHYPDKLLLCIDEFGTLESSIIIKDLLEKGRSGGIQTIFSILDVNQIAMNAGEHFVQAILGTINNYIIHAGATQSTAELLAGVQKYDKGYDIMNLRKPYKGKKPTALFISKYPILTKRNNQEVYRVIPYTRVLKRIGHFTGQIDNDEPVEETKPVIDIYEQEEQLNQVDLTQPIDNIEDYL